MNYPKAMGFVVCTEVRRTFFVRDTFPASAHPTDNFFGFFA